MYVGCQAGGGWAGSRWLNNHFTGVETCTAAVNFNLQCDQVNQSSACRPDINTHKTNLSALFASTLQLGYAWDRTLWYVKGRLRGVEPYTTLHNH